MARNEMAGGEGKAPEAGVESNARYYKKDFWSEENLKFSQPWYRLEKSAKIISKLAHGTDCALLDVGCGPATLMRLLPQNVDYYGIDIAIHDPAPNLVEADLLASPIAFGDRRFDLVIAQGVFEYMGGCQSQKFSEIAELLNANGRFITTYTNFSHRRKQIYSAFSNVRPFKDFRRDLMRYFKVDRVFPASHNWKHSQPDRELVKAINMRVNVNIPLLSQVLAVEYFLICSSLESRRSRAGR